MKKKKNIKLLAAIVCVIVVVAIVMQYFGVFEMWIYKTGTVREGRLPVTAGFDEVENFAGDTNVSYRINKNVTFASKHSSGDIMLENPPGSKYDIRLFIYIDGVVDGEPIYTSPKLSAGQFVQNDWLDKKLDKGEHTCVYIVKVYSPENPDDFIAEMPGYLSVTVGD